MNAGRWLRTVSPLRPSQLWHRVRLSLRRALWGRLGDRIDAAYRRRADAAAAPFRWGHAGLARVAARRASGIDPAAAIQVARDALDGRFTFLEQTRELGRPVPWHHPALDEARLWKTHLHEFPYAMHLAIAYRTTGAIAFRDGFFRLAREWREAAPIGRPGFALEAWNGRVVADRLLHWSTAGAILGLDEKEPDAQWLGRELAIHALFLRDNLELDLLANHLFRDAIGLVFAQELIGIPADAWSLLEREVREQILPDGGHIERCPMYHAHTLQDLIEVRELVRDQAPAWLVEAESRAAGFLSQILHGDGDIPLFGDGWRGEIDAGELIEAAAAHAAPIVSALPDPPSGLAVLRVADWHLVARVGAHGPDYQLGHAHADLLSFELSRGVTRLVTDTGTGQYAPGPARNHLRSTAAHNTVQIDGAELLEAWGSFRTGRRGRARVRASGESGEIRWMWASHDGYEWLPGAPQPHRLWILQDDGLWIADVVLGDGTHRIESRIHIHPGAASEYEPHALAGAVRRVEAPLHERFHTSQPMPVWIAEASASLPFAGGWVIGGPGNERPSLDFDPASATVWLRSGALAVRWVVTAPPQSAVRLTRT